MLIYNSCLAQRDASDLPPPPRRDAHLSSLRKDRKTHPDCVIRLTLKSSHAAGDESERRRRRLRDGLRGLAVVALLF